MDEGVLGAINMSDKPMKMVAAPKIIPVGLPVDDIRQSAATMTQKQARRLLSGYWRAQEARIGNTILASFLRQVVDHADIFQCDQAATVGPVKT